MTVVPLCAEFEHALVVFTGGVGIDGRAAGLGQLAYVGTGRDEIGVSTQSRELLFGGVPFAEPVVMWWNYVARTREEIVQAHADWMTANERFGHVDSTLPRIEVGPPPWTR